MSIIRVVKKHNPFVMIDKACLEDEQITWQAKGLLAYLLSRPDNWQVNVKHLVKQSKNGRDATYTILSELIMYRYIHRSETPTRDSEGKLRAYLYTVYETPYEEPYTENPDTVEPDTGNQEHNNIDSNKKEFNKFEEEESLAKLSKLYENNIGMITPVSAEWLKDAVDEYPADWFEPSLKEMLKNNVRTWNYWEAILKRWKVQGFQSDSRPKEKGKTPSKEEREKVYADWIASHEEAG